MNIYTTDSETAVSVKKYCANIGKNALLVQGAGGNVSWKDNETLWIKASGTWLSDALNKNIFVPVDLKNLKEALHLKNFSVTPVLKEASPLKPSIETLLHALLPQKIVVHLHAVDILAYLIQETCQTEFESLLGNDIPWVLVDYHKPGEALAGAVSKALKEKPETTIIFLKNHGVVIGGDDIGEIERSLDFLINRLQQKTEKHSVPSLEIEATIEQSEQYSPIQDQEIQELVFNPDLFHYLSSGWTLYPDHVVFLGAFAYVYPSKEVFFTKKFENNDLPELVFIKNLGVYVLPTFTQTKYAQLRCYYDVLKRLKPKDIIRTLSQPQVFELLNWDAELYRKQLSK